jgi:hypothetical protein
MQIQTAHVLRLTEKDIVMRHSRSVQDHVSGSEDRDLMLFSAWLLAWALLLEETYQQHRQCQIQKGRVDYVA